MDRCRQRRTISVIAFLRKRRGGRAGAGGHATSRRCRAATICVGVPQRGLLARDPQHAMRASTAARGGAIWAASKSAPVGRPRPARCCLTRHPAACWRADVKSSCSVGKSYVGRHEATGIRRPRRVVIDACCRRSTAAGSRSSASPANRCAIEAHCFTDGHDRLRVVLRWQAADETQVYEVEMTAAGQRCVDGRSSHRRCRAAIATP